MDQINMGKERGAIGAFVFIGKGMTGLVTKPVRGILDGGAGPMVALRKVVNGEDWAGVSAGTDPHTHR
jgi:hypothetical protein